MSDAPSIAALIVPWDVSSALERVGRALATRGMSPYKTSLPAGYKPAPDEWIGAVALPLPPLRRGRDSFPNAAVVTTDIARIFDFALLVSVANVDDVFVAWRRFAGFDPVMKVVWAGRPRWKHGEDPDHEVAYPVPQGQPAEARPPSESKVPLDAALVSSMLTPLVKPLRDPLKHGGAAWLGRNSLLR